MAVRKRPKKAPKGLDARFYPNERDARKCQNALVEYDRVVRSYEAKWGIDRLPGCIDNLHFPVNFLATATHLSFD